MHETHKELLTVTTLRRRLEQHGPLSVCEASAIIDQIAEEVDSTHNRGMMHGAITPENILLLPDGRARLLTTKPGGERSVRVRRVRRHALLTGPVYVSPEEARGETLTHTTDLWAMGALLYEMLTGHPPFTALRTAILMEMVAENEPEPLPAAAAAAQTVIDRALAKWPANRYISAQALANSLWYTLPHSEVVRPRSAATRAATATPLLPPTDRPYVRLNQAADRPFQFGASRPTRNEARGPRRFLHILGGLRQHQPSMPSAA